jgi:hypothetical protein
VAARDVDQLFARGFALKAPPQLLERTVTLGPTRVQLSDHLPILAELAREPPGAAPQTTR